MDKMQYCIQILQNSLAQTDEKQPYEQIDIYKVFNFMQQNSRYRLKQIEQINHGKIIIQCLHRKCQGCKFGIVFQRKKQLMNIKKEQMQQDHHRTDYQNRHHIWSTFFLIKKVMLEHFHKNYIPKKSEQKLQTSRCIRQLELEIKPLLSDYIEQQLRLNKACDFSPNFYILSLYKAQYDKIIKDIRNDRSQLKIIKKKFDNMLRSVKLKIQIKIQEEYKLIEKQKFYEDMKLVKIESI